MNQQEADLLKEELNRAKEEIRVLKDTISDVNVRIIAGMTENFDDNVYRKAMEHDFKEHVYVKIRNLFGAIAILAGTGGLVFVNTVIDNVVEDKIVEQQNEFVQASNNLTKERLIYLLREIDRGELDRLSEISEESDFSPILRDILQDRSEEQREVKILAVRYISVSKDRSLTPQLFELLTESPYVDVRVEVLSSLIEILPFAEVETEIATHLTGLSLDDDLWATFARITGVRVYQQPRTRQFVSNLMREALKSSRPDVFRGAVLFYMANPDLWESDYGMNLRNFAGLKKSDYINNLLENSGKELQRGRTSLQFLTSLYSESEDSLTRFQLRQMGTHIAIAELAAGRKEIVSEGLIGSMGLGKVADSQWKNLVEQYFPDFSLTALTEQQREQNSTLPQVEISPENLLAQQTLWSLLENYEWDSVNLRYRYSDPETRSIDALRRGELDQYINIMTTGYYDITDWTQRVYPLFPDALANVFGNTAPEGTNSQQDELWHWVESNQGLLVWNGQAFDYSAIDLETSSVAALNRGDLEQYLEIMAQYYFYQDTWLRDVFPLFPDSLEEVFAGTTPTGTNDEQDALWSWILSVELTFTNGLYEMVNQ